VDFQGAPSDNLAYQSKIQRRIRGSLSHGCHSFAEVVRYCQGAYPTIVRDLLERQPDVLSKLASMFRLTPATAIGPTNSKLAQIEGNPVLASWYFTDETCSRISRLWDWTQGSIAFLGTPRLYEWFASAGLGKRRILLDLDALVLATLADAQSGNGELLRYDAQSEVPENLRGQFDFVIFDPPWYPEDYGLWLQRAMTLAPGGMLCVSLFPELTRPAAAAQRLTIQKHMANFVEFSTAISDYLEYEIPSFEQNELAAANLGGIGPWKLSDLLICRLKRGLISQESRRPLHESAAWVEIDIGALRLFVDPRKHGLPSSPFLQCAVRETTILPSPSRRNPELANANLLSSRGHGLTCSAPDKLTLLLAQLREAHASQRPLSSEIDKIDIDNSSKKLLKVVILGGPDE